jgi:hypothetical protein
MEASFFQREKVLQLPGRRDLMDDIDPAEFVAEENLNYHLLRRITDNWVSL